MAGTRLRLRALGWAALLLLAGCAECQCPPVEQAQDEPPPPRLDLAAVTFEDLKGWEDDDPSGALIAFRRSCEVILDQPDEQPLGQSPVVGRAGDWKPSCADADRLPSAVDGEVARAFFERWFTPYRVTDRGEPEGLFTGYYEPLLHGSRRPGGRYTIPLHGPPADLIRIDLGRFDPDLAGQWIAGRVADGTFVPYHPRRDIENGALANDRLELVWVDDPIDKFFLQIQGSGRVQLDDGSLIRVGYAAQNGHPYRAIGRDLIEIGALSREAVSMQTIRAWLEANPAAAREIMNRNRSYVFFEERRVLDEGEGPLGAQGVPLTAGRSLAVDLRFLPLGAPVWLETTAPYPEGEQAFRRLVIAQDTGGAIDGVVRGDVFWGAGELAEATAGRMKSQGRYAVLLPRALAPTS
jgi:membrane-bound lytic murein transglycosylase A